MADIRVTVIDDDQDVLDTLVELLEYYDYEATAINRPISRIEEVVDTRPDLILIDLRLDQQREELSGLQTVHAARTSSALREVPVVVCSGDLDALADAWPGLMERGDVHQLVKPFDLITFERVMAMALGHPPRIGPLTDVGMDDAGRAQREA